MTRNIALELITFGGILVAASVGLYISHPEIGFWTIVMAGTGGTLCLFWGVRGWSRGWGLLPAKVTVGVLAILFAARTVTAWWNLANGSVERAEPIICTVGVVISCGVMLMLMQEGK